MKDLDLKIGGERLFLRYALISDFEELRDVWTKSLEFYRGFSNPPLKFEEFDDFIKRGSDEANEFFVICRNVENNIVGSINLSQIFRKVFQNCYLGYSLGADFTGKGYMTEAVGLMLQHVFENLKLHRVEANVQPHNLASIRVLERCGFTKEGFSRKYLKIDEVWCDHERWAMIAEDWEALKINDSSTNKKTRIGKS